MGLLSRIFYPIFRRNSTYVAFIITGGLILDPVFNNTTSYCFNDVMNKGNSFKYLEPKLLALAAASDDDDDDE